MDLNKKISTILEDAYKNDADFKTCLEHYKESLDYLSTANPPQFTKVSYSLGNLTIETNKLPQKYTLQILRFINQLKQTLEENIPNYKHYSNIPDKFINEQDECEIQTVEMGTVLDKKATAISKLLKCNTAQLDRINTALANIIVIEIDVQRAKTLMYLNGKLEKLNQNLHICIKWTDFIVI